MEILKQRVNFSNYYLWKYMDIHRFLYFVQTKRLYFSRLDSLNDPVEGVKAKLLREKSFFDKIPDNPAEINPNIPAWQRRKIANKKKLVIQLFEQERDQSQKKQFVNCWFMGNRESMAMWELYSKKDSIALKFKAKLLIDIVNESLIPFEKKFPSFTTVCGLVKYKKLNPFDPGQPMINLPYSAFKKDESYKHENELRFLIALPKKEKNYTLFKIPLVDIKLEDFEIIAHPNMDDWKLQNIKRLVKAADLDAIVLKSKIELRKN